jgi:ABC-type branched-subunit amino acid transport system ATPase component
MKTGLLTGGLFFGPARREEIRNRKVVEEIIDFLEIESIRHAHVGTLGYGLRKRVDLGRALAQEPQILLMDEPMAGMNPEEKEEIAHRRLVEDIIDFLEIQHIRKKVVGTLPYGLQKRVELARALALTPKLLLLDEPMAGMNAEEKEDMARFVLDINEERGTTIVMIEHDMGVVMDVSHRVCVLNFGEKIADGTPEEVQANPDVQAAYLGEEAPAPAEREA